MTCANGTDAPARPHGVGRRAGRCGARPDSRSSRAGRRRRSGATPVFVDVDERTFNLDAAKLEEAVRFVERETDLVPRVVVAVDLFGLPADYPAIRKVCERHGLLLLEDGAQGFGGSIDGKMACSFGDVSTTSFFPAKPLAATATAARCCRLDEWAELVRSYAVHGKELDEVRQRARGREQPPRHAPGGGAAGEARRVRGRAGRRERGGCPLLGALAESGLALPEVPEGYRSSWAQYTVRLPEGLDRDALQAALKERGVPTMVYYPKPMHGQGAFEGAHLCPDGCPVTKRLCETVLSLPMGPYLTADEVLSAVHFIDKWLVE
ncbi:MAG: DegT/DnrJ/EryC1/StrS family aminotransferase [Eggerthellaceae bacterium]